MGKQVAALLTFPTGVTRLQVIELLEKLNETSVGSGVAWNNQEVQTQEFDPEWGGVVIYQP